MSHQIELEGVAVHNLRDIDVTIPHHRLVAVCGVSGSGKTSLALDTLYAEGQRRYIESFSAYTRQFLERLEKPQAERIAGLPPAIAVTHKNSARSSRATVGTSTEIVDYLRLLYARIGRVVCHACACSVRRDTPESAAAYLNGLPDGTRYMLAFPVTPEPEQSLDDLAKTWQEDGFIRWIVDGQIQDLTNRSPSNGDAAQRDAAEKETEIQIIVDRLVAGKVELTRLRDSLETSLAKGEGRCRAFIADLPCDSGRSARHKRGRCDRTAIRPNSTSNGIVRRQAMVYYRIQRPSHVRRLRARLSKTGAEAFQLQQSTGSVPDMRRLRKHDGNRNGTGCSRSRKVPV